MDDDRTTPADRPVSSALLGELFTGQRRRAGLCILCGTRPYDGAPPPSCSSTTPETPAPRFDRVKRAVYGSDPGPPEPTPICAQCTATIEARSRAAEADAARLAALQLRDEVRASLGTIPENFRDIDGARLAAAPCRAAAIDEARKAIGTATMALLVGGSGAGKTTVATYMMQDLGRRALDGDQEAANLARSMLWVTSTDIAKAPQRHKLGEGEPALIERAKKVRLLLIDDLGQERCDASAIVDVICRRHDRKALTVVTTGLASREIEKHYGSGIYRRLVEKNRASFIVCDNRLEISRLIKEHDPIARVLGAALCREAAHKLGLLDLDAVTRVLAQVARSTTGASGETVLEHLTVGAAAELSRSRAA